MKKFFFSDLDDPVEVLCSAIDKNSRLGVDKLFPAKFFVPMIHRLGLKDFEVSSLCVDEVRAVKDAKEIEWMRESSRINDLTMEKIAQFLSEGVTEIETADKIQQIYKELGADIYPWGPSVCFGTNTAEAHHTPDKTSLRKGDIILIDTGCKVNEYGSDMTRVFCCGQEATPFQQEIYQIVRTATETAEKLCGPGVPLAEIDRAARKVIEDAGYGANFNHRTGHFIGLETHDYGEVSPRNKECTLPGDIFSIEPSIYLEGQFQLYVEDLVLITEDGCEILNHYPHEIQVVGLSHENQK